MHATGVVSALEYSALHSVHTNTHQKYHAGIVRQKV